MAHRGSSASLPEHTLAAYEQAVAEGADALECDVRLTRDGVLVCLHDRRLERTSSGAGPLSTKTLADLSGLDFGSWHAVGTDEEGLRTPDRRRVLTLERLLQLVLDADDAVALHVETKHPTRSGASVERALAALLASYGVDRPSRGEPARVTVMSFSLVALARAATLVPALPRLLLVERVPRWLAGGRLPPSVDGVGLGLAGLRADPGYPARVRARARGGRVHVWTVNEPGDVARALEADVDAVITDRPAQVRAAVDARG